MSVFYWKLPGILFWSLCVYKEYRNIWLGLEAVWQIPRSNHSIFRKNTLRRICKVRFRIILFTYLARAAIAALLLGAGIRWLARTTSITDLMLNCVALSAILDVDEFHGFEKSLRFWSCPWEILFSVFGLGGSR